MCSQTVECDPTEWLWSIVSTEIWMRSNFMIQLWEDWAVTERLNGWWSLTCYFSLQTRNHLTNISGPGPGDPGLRYRRSQMKHPVKSPEEVRLSSHRETSSRHQNTYSVVSSCTVERVCFYCTADSGWSPLFTPLSVDPTLCFHLWHSDGVHRVQSVLRRGEWGEGETISIINLKRNSQQEMWISDAARQKFLSLPLSLFHDGGKCSDRMILQLWDVCVAHLNIPRL